MGYKLQRKSSGGLFVSKIWNWGIPVVATGVGPLVHGRPAPQERDLLIRAGDWCHVGGSGSTLLGGLDLLGNGLGQGPAPWWP